MLRTFVFAYGYKTLKKINYIKSEFEYLIVSISERLREMFKILLIIVQVVIYYQTQLFRCKISTNHAA